MKKKYNINYIEDNLNATDISHYNSNTNYYSLGDDLDSSKKESKNVFIKYRLKAIEKYGYRDDFKLNLFAEVLPFFFLVIFIPIFFSLVTTLLIKNRDLYSFLNQGISIGLAIIFFVIISIKFKFHLKRKKIYVFFLYFPFIRIILSIVLIIILSTSTLSLDVNNNPFHKKIYYDIVWSFQIFESIVSLIIIWLFFYKNNESNVWFKKAFLVKNLWITLLVIILGFFIFYGLQFCLSLISTAINKNDNSESANQSALKSMLGSPIGIIALFFSAVIVAPILEEILYRHFISLFFNHTIYGYICSTIYFAFLHVANAGDFNNIFPYFALGIVSGFIYYYSKNLVPCIAIHFIANLVAFIIMMIQ